MGLKELVGEVELVVDGVFALIVLEESLSHFLHDILINCRERFSSVRVIFLVLESLGWV